MRKIVIMFAGSWISEKTIESTYWAGFVSVVAQSATSAAVASVMGLGWTDSQKEADGCSSIMAKRVGNHRLQIHN